MKFAAPLPPTPTINVALIGPPKTGKTAGAASAPGPILYVNSDLPTATRFARQKFGDEKVQEAVFEPVEGAKTVKVLDAMAELHYMVFDPSNPYKTIVIDPVGELYRLLLEEQSNRALSPSLPTYGAVATHVERFLRNMCEAPINTIFVCHAWIKDNGNDEVVTLPFTGSTGDGGVKLGNKLLGMVDVIGFTGVYRDASGEEHYAAQLVNQNGRQGGDRFGVLADPQTGSRDVDISEWLEVITASESSTTTKQNSKEKK